MQTSCPACRTTFRVHQDQLGLRRGLVRCGNCNAVFNAYDTLLPELEGAPAEEISDNALDMPVAAPDALLAPDDRLQAGAAPVLTQAPFDVRPAAGDLEPKGAEEVLAEASPGLSILSRQALSHYDAAAQPLAEEGSPGEAGGEQAEAPSVTLSLPASATSEQESPDAILLSELPHRRAAGPRPPVWKTLFKLSLATLLALLLLGQMAYFLRAELAAALPASRPLLIGFCQPLGCRVPMPRQLTRQAIVSSSLEHDAEQKSRVRLTFLLANRTGQTQEWPHVVLTLSDLRESPVAQKAFPPEDYLPKGTSPRAGFPPLSEQEVRLELDIGNLSAASYLLDVAYP